jgi:hypothetical protein
MPISIVLGTFTAAPWDRSVSGDVKFNVGLSNEDADTDCKLRFEIVDTSAAARFASTQDTTETIDVTVPSGGKVVHHASSFNCVKGIHFAAFTVRVHVVQGNMEVDDDDVLLDVNTYTCGALTFAALTSALDVGVEPEIAKKRRPRRRPWARRDDEE